MKGKPYIRRRTSLRLGNIFDDDMLSILELFALEPTEWAARYDWRKLTQVKRYALGMFWKDMGEPMKIAYD
jgi:hypothetical protein